jgi:hypothetical protein
LAFNAFDPHARHDLAFEERIEVWGYAASAPRTSASRAPARLERFSPCDYASGIGRRCIPNF